MPMRISGLERLLALLGYLPFPFFMIPLKAKKDSLFVQFHARQGMVLFLLWFAASLLLFILLFPTGGNVVGNIILGLLMLVTGLYALLFLVGAFKVLLGERYRMPVVADVALMMRL